MREGEKYRRESEKESVMRRKGGGTWQLRFVLLLFHSVFLHPIIGSAADPSSSKDGAKNANPSNSSSSTGTKVLYVFLGLVAVALLAFFLFKMWQKKKREEQHARLLRLFEEDDELEVELGLRD